MKKTASSPPAPVRHAITIHLSPVQLRMLAQIADMQDGGTMADIVRSELGRHVCLHLECYYRGHDLNTALARWEREGKGVPNV